MGMKSSAILIFYLPLPLRCIKTLTQNITIMKKIILIAALVLGFATAAVAQPRAIGIRGGYGAELSYQHSLGANFIQADLGLVGHGVTATATYNWMLAQPDWTDRGEWGFYAGPGAALGVVGKSFCAAIAGQVGLEYTFWFPLQLSVDLRPQIGFWAGNKTAGFYGLESFCPTLAVRYRF